MIVVIDAPAWIEDIDVHRDDDVGANFADFSCDGENEFGRVPNTPVFLFEKIEMIDTECASRCMLLRLTDASDFVAGPFTTAITFVTSCGAEVRDVRSGCRQQRDRATEVKIDIVRVSKNHENTLTIRVCWLPLFEV